MNNSDWLLIGGVFLVPRGCVVSHLGGVSSSKRGVSIDRAYIYISLVLPAPS